jgi:hypothetical protein
MIQVVYLLVVTTIISLVQLCWNRAQRDKRGEQRQDVPKGESRKSAATSGSAPWDITSAASLSVVEMTVFEVIDMGRKIMIDSLHFVYAWAVLDTVNALFFTFLLHCSGPGDCGYPSNFCFAFILTVTFARATEILIEEDRRQEWNIAATNLLLNSFSLCVGWAWSNFCASAIRNAVEIDEVSHNGTWLIALAFVWLAVSAVYHRFMIEQHAWERYHREGALGHGIDQALHIKTREMESRSGISQITELDILAIQSEMELKSRSGFSHISELDLRKLQFESELQSTFSV